MRRLFTEPAAPGGFEAALSTAGTTREDVLKHLKEGVLVGTERSVGFFTDGAWVWSEDVISALEGEAVSLPIEFLEHVTESEHPYVAAKGRKGSALRLLGVKSPYGRFGI